MVIGNCMVDAITKEAMRTLLGSGPSTGASLSALIRSPSAVVQERALTLCGNMCGDPELRRALVAQQGLLDLSGDMAARGGAKGSIKGGSSSETSKRRPDTTAPEKVFLPVQLSAATLLFNASIEPEAQRLLLAEGLAPRLLDLMRHDNMTLVARAAGIMARCCRHPLSAEHLLIEDAAPGGLLRALMDLLRRCCPAIPSLQPVVPPNKETTSGGEADCEDRFSAIDAATRALAVVSHDEGPSGAECVARLINEEAIEMLSSILRQMLPASPSTTGSLGAGTAAKQAKPAIRESIMGNSALCISHLAR